MKTQLPPNAEWGTQNSDLHLASSEVATTGDSGWQPPELWQELDCPRIMIVHE